MIDRRKKILILDEDGEVVASSSGPMWVFEDDEVFVAEDDSAMVWEDAA